MSHLKAIGGDEFLRLLGRCKPPSGWGINQTVAVANSGGPDSTCLSFLLKQAIYSNPVGHDVFTSVRSLTVDHALQESSSEMAQHCEDFSKQHSIPHISYRIPWGNNPYPNLPEPGQAFEEVARRARYRAMFDGMTNIGADVIAMGHHADDQIETSLMRLAKGSTELGAAGMRQCRRWGMGSGREGQLGYHGYEGMNRWIVRPLLTVSKDRILATCEKHSLEYVTDQTNFQPALAVRNAIRHMINDKFGKSEYEKSQPPVPHLDIPPNILTQVNAAEKAMNNLKTVDVDTTSGRDRLISAMRTLAEQRDDTEWQATAELKRRRLPSPISTFLLSTRDLKSLPTAAVRAAMILRICRYVSFRPWGSVQAEVHRRTASVDNISARVFLPFDYVGPDRASPFSAGSGVGWDPVIVRAGRIFRSVSQTVIEPGDVCAWLAKRETPPKFMQYCDTIQDVTTLLKQAIERGAGQTPKDDIQSVLYDNRFRVRFMMSRMPTHIRDLILGGGQIWIKPYSPYVLPVVVTHATNGWGLDMLEQTLIDHRPNALETLAIHTHGGSLREVPRSSKDLLRRWNKGEPDVYTTQTASKAAPKWIRITFIRPLDNI